MQISTNQGTLTLYLSRVLHGKIFSSSLQNTPSLLSLIMSKIEVAKMQCMPIFLLFFSNSSSRLDTGLVSLAVMSVRLSLEGMFSSASVPTIQSKLRSQTLSLPLFIHLVLYHFPLPQSPYFYHKERRHGQEPVWSCHGPAQGCGSCTSQWPCRH